MELKKILTISAAALMLAGVGASTTNVGVPAHASKRTVRISNLRSQKNHLNRQIKRDHFQIKKINREMARLSRKAIRKGKRSKRTVKRHKHVKKANQKQAQNSEQNNKQTQTTARKTHIEMNNKVYTAEIVSNGKTGKILPRTVKYVSTMKAYAKKYTKPFLANQQALKTNYARFQKTHSAKAYVKAMKAYQANLKIGVTPVNMTKK